MTATTIEQPASSALLHTLLRFTFAVVLAVVLSVGAFAVGRATSPTHTVRSVVTVPAASADGSADVCHIGRAC
jgi:hypothetical protein